MAGPTRARGVAVNLCGPRDTHWACPFTLTSRHRDTALTLLPSLRPAGNVLLLPVPAPPAL